MERILCVLIGYICGLFQTSYLYGKVHGIDIRNYGSGNAGTTNALRTLGAKAGAITLLGDCFKCVVAVVIVHLIFGKSHPEMIRLLGMYAADCFHTAIFPENILHTLKRDVRYLRVHRTANLPWRTLCEATCLQVWVR